MKRAISAFSSSENPVAAASRNDGPADKQRNKRKHEGRHPERESGAIQGRAHQDIIAIPGVDVRDDLLVAVTGNKPFAHQYAQVPRNPGVGAVDVPILADNAAQFP